jgi:hypothetical protein
VEYNLKITRLSHFNENCVVCRFHYMCMYNIGSRVVLHIVFCSRNFVSRFFWKYLKKITQTNYQLLNAMASGYLMSRKSISLHIEDIVSRVCSKFFIVVTLINRKTIRS